MIRHFSRDTRTERPVSITGLSFGMTPSASGGLLIPPVVGSALRCAGRHPARRAAVALTPVAISTHVENGRAQTAQELPEKNSCSVGHFVGGRQWTEAPELCEAELLLVEMPFRRRLLPKPRPLAAAGVLSLPSSKD